MPDITEMNVDRFLNIHFPKLCPKTSGQLTGIIVSTICSSKAWHGHCCNTSSWQVQAIHCSCCHQKCQCGIKTTGNTDDHAFTMGMLHTFLQSHGLDGKNLLTTFLALLLPSRHEGSLVHITVKRCIRGFHLISYFHITIRICSYIIGRIMSSLSHQTFNVQVSIDSLVGESFRLCQHGAVLCDQMMSPEYQIRGGLSFACAGVDIAAYQTAGLNLHQIPAIGILAGNLITGRQIDDHSRTVHGVADAGRIGRPQIFADLRCHLQARHGFTGKQKICSKGNSCPILPCNRSASNRCCRKMTRLIELTVIGNICLRHQSQQISVRISSCHIVELSVYFQWKTCKEKTVHAFTCRYDLLQRFFRSFQQNILAEQVGTGVTGNAKLRKYNDPGTLLPGFPHQTDGFLCIVLCISHANLRRDRCCLHKSIFHLICSF